MLSDKIIDKLTANWGAMCDSLSCNAEAKLYDPNGIWECYMLAINPQDDDETRAIIVDEDNSLYVETISLSHLLSKWNGEGEFMELDTSFVPRLASELYKVLKERHP